MAFNRNAVRLIQNNEAHEASTYNRPINDLMDQIANGDVFAVNYVPEPFIVPTPAVATTTITLPRPSSRVHVYIDGRLIPPSDFSFTTDTSIITMDEAYEPNETVVVMIDPLVNNAPTPAVPETVEITGQSGTAIVLPRVVTFAQLFIDGRMISPANYTLTPVSGSNTISLNFSIDSQDVVMLHII